MQDKFKDKLQVILVTEDQEEKVRKTFQRLKRLENVALDQIVEDTVFSESFAFRSVPTHVWISETGKVLQITDGKNTTEDKIVDYFEGKDVKLTVKHQNKDFNRSAPLWLEGNGRQLKHMKYYSFIMNYVPDANGGYGVLKDRETGKDVSVNFNNSSLLWMLKVAYSEDGAFYSNPFFHKSRVILNVKDPTRLIPPAEAPKLSEWNLNNLYCYELVVPPAKSDQLFNFLQQDLERYFGIRGRIEKRSLPCLMLKHDQSNNKLMTSGGKSYYNRNPGVLMTIKNRPFDKLTQELSVDLSHLPTPLIDATGITTNIDLEFEGSLQDLNNIRTQLAPYGITITEEQCDLEVLIITD